MNTLHLFYNCYTFQYIRCYCYLICLVKMLVVLIFYNMYMKISILMLELGLSLRLV